MHSHTLPCKDDALEETGWKLVHGDVFRPPSHPTLLVACLGSGIQTFCMGLIIIGESEGWARDSLLGCFKSLLIIPFFLTICFSVCDVWHALSGQ